MGRDEFKYHYKHDSEDDVGRIKVLYIMGMTRSGSTILDRILGQCKGYFSLGEAYSIWDLNVLQNQRCGCGSPFNQCEVWTRIFERAYGGIYPGLARQMMLAWDGCLRTRHIPRMFSPYSGKLRTQRISRFKLHMEKLYRAIRDITDTKVVIDSSKFPTYAKLLTEAPSIELYVLHVVRDPRAVAYSWLRRKKEPSTGNAEGYMGKMTPTATAKLWDAWNIAGELAFAGRNIPYLRVRYEDFIDEPRDTVEKIIDLVGEPVDTLPFISDNLIRLHVNHTLAGNPNRFSTGMQELRIDDVWNSKLDYRHKRLITSLTWPLLKRYGYRLRV
jgi:hypothetical protein